MTPSEGEDAPEGTTTSVLDIFFSDEFNEYVRGRILEEIRAGRHAHLIFNVFNVLLDPDVGTATLQFDIGNGDEETIGLRDFERLIEQQTLPKAER